MEIQQLLKKGFKKAAIARKLGISRPTLYKYLEKNPPEMAEWVHSLQTRRKKLDPYQELIISWLKEHQDMTAAQVYDWLLERYPSLNVGESTVRAYVRELREKYDIPKKKSTRSYEAVPELPMGAQAQVDFGQTTQKTADGRFKKLYFIAFVLSHSRYKYKEWLDRPFTTRDVIRTHENAFEWFGGIPHELVYDQDSLMIVSENGGDLILTEEFQTYCQERNLNLHVCRKADPESKGKIENVVGFIKHNYADHRIFHGIDKWNENGWEWLRRTGNYKVHNTTKKRPVDVFQEEKLHLRPVQKISISNSISSITRTVRKDNTIRYGSNRYSVPLGTYEKHKKVYTSETSDGYLLIFKTANGPEIAKHKIYHGKGKLIQDRQHTRDRSKGINEYITSVANKFSNVELARAFLEQIRKEKPRYIRDQIQLISKQLKEFDSSLVDKALKECMEKKLFSATDFIDIIHYLDRQRQEHFTVPTDTAKSVKPLHSFNQSVVETSAGKRDVNEYVAVLEGQA